MGTRFRNHRWTWRKKLEQQNHGEEFFLFKLRIFATSADVPPRLPTLLIFPPFLCETYLTFSSRKVTNQAACLTWTMLIITPCIPSPYSTSKSRATSFQQNKPWAVTSKGNFPSKANCKTVIHLFQAAFRHLSRQGSAATRPEARPRLPPGMWKAPW